MFGLGEHHRPDYAVSAPAVVACRRAARTKRIRLTSAVTVLSSDDPVRVYQQFATLDLLSGGRAEIMAGRGSFIESFSALRLRPRRLRRPLRGKTRSPARDPRERASGLARRAPRAAERRGRLSARAARPPARLDRLRRHAAIGGALGRARPAAGDRHHRRRAGAVRPACVALSRGGSARGVAPGMLKLGINGHGFLADTTEAAVEAFFPPYAEAMSRIGRERGWPPLSRAQFDAGRSPRGHSDARERRTKRSPRSWRNMRFSGTTAI